MDNINYKEEVRKMYPNAWQGASANIWKDHETCIGTLGYSWKEAYYNMYKQLELELTLGLG